MKSLIKSLCSCEGNEEIINLASDELKQYANVIVDKNKNVIATIKSKNPKKHLVLDAHIDTIHLVITHIDDKGFISFTNNGGVDVKYLPGQRVKILGKEKINGVISTVPPHLCKAKDERKIQMDSLYIDTGLDYDEISDVVSVGDIAIFADKPVDLLGHNISSPCLDDRAGMAAIIACLKLLEGKVLDVDLTVVFSQHEETMCSGAKTAAYSLKADEAIIVDVSFAIQPMVEGVYANLEKEIIIGMSPTLSYSMTEKLKQLASKNNIAYSIEAMGGRTATNADYFSVSKNGVPCANLFIPLRYMHSPVEVVNIYSVELAAKLLSEYVLSFGEEQVNA